MKGFNSKILVFGAVASILLIAIIMPSLPSASAATTLCIWPKISSGVFEDILVQTGFDCSLNKGVVVTGSILIEEGAKFTANGVSIGGDVSADKADMISITGSTIGGDMVIKNTNYATTMSVSKNIIVGELVIEGNMITNGMTVALNNIGGTLKFFKNNATSFIMIGGNTIGGSLECDTNYPHDFYGDVIDMVTIRGLNTVTNAKTGQCVGM